MNKLPKKARERIAKPSKEFTQKINNYASQTLREYQMKFFLDASRFRIVNKARQIGFTFLVAFEMIVYALFTGVNQLFISASQDNANIAIAYALDHLAELGFPPLSSSKEIIELSNGSYIKALATNWRTARGFAGDVYFDEMAFILQDNLVWTALVPSITAVNGRITCLSTPKSRIDKFWLLFEDDNNAFSKHQITIHDAVKQGLDINIEELRSLFTAEEFAMTYECVPLDTTDSFIPYAIIEPCIIADPEPYSGDKYWGVDIGRTKDETAGIALSDAPNPMVTDIFELHKKPFAVQKEYLTEVLRRQNTLKMGIDKGGIGMNLVEDLTDRFGDKVAGYTLAPAVKERLAKAVKAAFEEKYLNIPNHPSLINHILAIKRKPTKTNIFSYGSETKEHHSDKFWGLAIALDIKKGPRIIDNVLAI